MHSPIRVFAAVFSLGAALISPVAWAQEPSAVSVKDFDLFVDLPTAYAFIKLPTGWKFVGKLDAAQLSHLPSETITSLLPAEQVDAVQSASTAKPRDVQHQCATRLIES